jgi:hypothetical protein
MAHAIAPFYRPSANPEFKRLWMRVVFRKDESRPSYRSLALSVPSDDAKGWDGAPSATHCMLNREGLHGEQWSYIVVKITGRKFTKAGNTGALGVRAKIVMNMGTVDEETVDGWIVVDVWRPQGTVPATFTDAFGFEPAPEWS